MWQHLDESAAARRIQPVIGGAAAFLGAAESGPEDTPSPALTSFAGFERLYGTSAPTFLSEAVRAFFEEGGERGYAVRISNLSAYARALKALESIEDISTVAAPGNGADVIQQLIEHAERMRYRIAVLDGAPGQSFDQIRSMRASIHSSSAALYYPWLRTQAGALVPASAVAAGIFARVDRARGLHKAPANEAVHSATALVHPVSQAEQERLNPEGINCFREFPGRGILLWGARTTAADADWKYVNVRRYAGYLEHSVDHGTQWVAFEPNGESLWANVKALVSDFLFNEWRSGALLGAKPEQAYFVRCDRTTMTQDDVDNGRLVMQIGIAPVRPAEFVIIRIGQWTADHKKP